MRVTCADWSDRPVAMPLWRLAVVAVLTLTAGAVMVAAGYAWRSHGWAVAGLVMVPGGLLISLALALTQSPRVPAGEDSGVRRPRRALTAAAVIAGLPWPTGEIPWRYAASVSLIALVSGGSMAGAGWAVAASDWLIAIALVVVGGLAILAAFAVALVGARRSAPTPKAGGRPLA